MSEVRSINWSGYQFLPEAGRATYFPMIYFIIHAYWRAARHPRWPLRIPVLGDFAKHSTRWHYAVRNSHVFDPYLVGFLKNPKRINALRQYIRQQLRRVRSEFSQKTYSEFTTAALARSVREFYIFIEDLIVAAGTLRYLDRAIVPALQKAYGQHANPDVLVARVSAGEESFALREERAMLILAAQLQRRHLRVTSPHAIAGVKKIWSRYRWSSCGYYNEQPKTIAVYSIELRALLKQDASRALRTMQSRIKKDQRERRASLRLLQPRDRKLGVLAGQATVAKDEYRFAVSELIGLAAPMFEEIVRRTGYSVDAIHELLPMEVASVLNGKRYPSSLVHARTRHAIAIYGPRRTFDVLVGQPADAFQKKHLNRNNQAASTLKGRAASPGIVRGPVRVVLGVHDFSKVKRGDILVCLNTSPEFMPILKKVAGIVGEEGGLTAHVSVVSRELGIPCVVAINHATQILKDGARIELDATRGVVIRL